MGRGRNWENKWEQEKRVAVSALGRRIVAEE